MSRRSSTPPRSSRLVRASTPGPTTAPASCRSSAGKSCPASIDAVLWTCAGRFLSRRTARHASTLLRFPRDRVGRITGHYPARRSGHHGFILKPEKPEVVDALRKVRLDDDVSRNHSARNVGVVRAVVAVGLRL